MATTTAKSDPTGFEWIEAYHQWIPPLAVEGGIDPELGGALSVLYVARAAIENEGTYPGKANYNYAWIPHKGRVTQLEKGYEVLIAPQNDKLFKYFWFDITGPFSTKITWKDVPCISGKDKDGNILYVAQADIDGGTHSGYVSNGEIASIPHGDKVEKVETYRVLVQAHRGQ
ncbi:uncharacterized protein FOMMEDRAFT_31073 [Fomitiporia mediterranea MF3/22]|uniref:uncharacterized protein n=1 Tax=Fomitiporia mediterranea (strain MF3/22) TaxID=694068 RepID=UPI00044098FA|nr:uncharacterized protein FOMMEDRAFT_31073 [Fomitiporia mediterranea MF3/22]EJC99814.1 hypothetical protein FOMMEDRAFT_31073 [Fomitiporia mediterranea MF3/22]